MHTQKVSWNVLIGLFVTAVSDIESSFWLMADFCTKFLQYNARYDSVAHDWAWVSHTNSNFRQPICFQIRQISLGLGDLTRTLPACRCRCCLRCRLQWGRTTVPHQDLSTVRRHDLSTVPRHDQWMVRRCDSSWTWPRRHSSNHHLPRRRRRTRPSPLPRPGRPAMASSSNFKLPGHSRLCKLRRSLTWIFLKTFLVVSRMVAWIPKRSNLLWTHLDWSNYKECPKSCIRSKECPASSH